MLADDENVILPRDRALLENIVGSRSRPVRAEVQRVHGLIENGFDIGRGCASKKSWFSTPAEAEKAANDVSARYGTQFRFYRCRVCFKYHLTTSGVGQRTA